MHTSSIYVVEVIFTYVAFPGVFFLLILNVFLDILAILGQNYLRLIGEVVLSHPL